MEWFCICISLKLANFRYPNGFCRSRMPVCLLNIRLSTPRAVNLCQEWSAADLDRSRRFIGRWEGFAGQPGRRSIAEVNLGAQRQRDSQPRSRGDQKRQRPIQDLPSQVLQESRLDNALRSGNDPAAGFRSLCPSVMSVAALTDG